MIARIVIVVAAAMLGGCGYVGDPQPPALNIPARIVDLSAVQQADRIVATFTISPLTTEGLPVRVGEVDLRVGPVIAGQPFDASIWANSAAKVASTMLVAGPAKESTPSEPFAGKYVTVAVRIQHRKGRYSDWSNAVTLRIVPSLTAPSAVSARNVARGVELSWQASAPPGATYRIYRQAQKESEPVLLGKSPASPYVDETTQYGVPYQYQVQTALETEGANAESARSSALSAPIVPKDEFPPAAPVGLTAIPGITAVELSWERNTESDLAFYRVYRSEGDAPRQRIGDQVQTPVFSDSKVESGKRYRYAITAVDRVGNESQPSPPVEQSAP